MVEPEQPSIIASKLRTALRLEITTKTIRRESMVTIVEASKEIKKLRTEIDEIKKTGDIDRLIDAKINLNSLQKDLNQVIFQRLGKIVDMSRYPLSFMEREKFLKDLLPIEQQIFLESKEKMNSWNLVLLNYLSDETTAEAENNGF